MKKNDKGRDYTKFEEIILQKEKQNMWMGEIISKIYKVLTEVEGKYDEIIVNIG